MKKAFLLSIPLLFFSLTSYGQDTLKQRTYNFGAFSNYDLRNSSTNFISTQRFLNDQFNSFVETKLGSTSGAIARGVFSFTTTYITMLGSHEIGHSIRAKQVGGKFIFHDIYPPVPFTTAELPDDISLVNEAIFVTAGFEVNYSNVRAIQSQFIRQNGLWNEDLAFAFSNRLMYTIYTSLVVPIDPEDRNVWIETAGDPVHYILPVFKNYSNNQVFMPDSSVNPKLVSLYNEASLAALFFQFLDPNFYREIGASFGNTSKRRTPIFLIGDYSNGWTYGTLFNASPLGYELYMQNYIHVNDHQYGLYIKYGRPFKNIGMGISLNDIIQYKKFKSDFLVEIWQQDLFGDGISAEFSGQYKINHRFGLTMNLGYKTEGYVLGKQLDSGLYIGAGICFYTNRKW